MKYLGTKFDHNSAFRPGILILNLGSPEAPTKKALRPYLKEFLSDPRIIELPRVLWLTILNLFVLNTRPKRSAKLYQNIWTEEGAPLAVFTKRQAEKLQALLKERHGIDIPVDFGMRYGKLSIKAGLQRLKDKQVNKILILPLYPQYSATTTGSILDGVFAELKTWRYVPEIRTVNTYHDKPEYITAIADSITKLWKEKGEPEKIIFSFHGTPLRYLLNGDPYHCMCLKTARLVAEKLQLPREKYEVSFQSIFGREKWIGPYTDETIEKLAQNGIKKLDVICPGFSVDCLETVDEIDRESRHVFMENGGEEFRYIPALNDTDEHIDLISKIVLENTLGWKLADDKTPEEIKKMHDLFNQLEENKVA